MKTRIAEAMTEDEAEARLVGLFTRHSMIERLGPVVVQLQKHLRVGCVPDAERVMPSYCYNIFSILGRTYFKVISPRHEIAAVSSEGLPECKTIREAAEATKVDWRKFGRVVGVGLRGLQFMEFELANSAQAKELVELDPKESEQFQKLFGGKESFESLATDPKFAMLVEAFEKNPDEAAAEQINSLKGLFTPWQDVSYQCGPVAMAEFNEGQKEGLLGWMDESGHYAGESNRGPIYWMLLVLWPEIKEMQTANPPKSRKHLAELLTPFSVAGILSQSVPGQIDDICEDIGLAITGRGRPGKSE